MKSQDLSIFVPADPGDFAWAGKHKVPTQGYGNVDIQIRNQKGIGKILRLYDVAFCQDFASNLVSLRQLHKQGIWWDNRPGYNHLRRTNSSAIAVLEPICTRVHTRNYSQNRLLYTTRGPKDDQPSAML